MPDFIRWGLLSTARINEALIDPIQKSPRSQLYGIASRDMEKAQSDAAKHQVEQAYGSCEAMLADPSIDAVYISLPNALHCEWTIKAAEAGKHILCEKPMAVTLDEFDRMAAA